MLLLLYFTCLKLYLCPCYINNHILYISFTRIHKNYWQDVISTVGRTTLMKGWMNQKWFKQHLHLNFKKHTVDWNFIGNIKCYHKSQKWNFRCAIKFNLIGASVINAFLVRVLNKIVITVWRNTNWEAFRMLNTYYKNKTINYFVLIPGFISIVRLRYWISKQRESKFYCKEISADNFSLVNLRLWNDSFFDINIYKKGQLPHQSDKNCSDGRDEHILQEQNKPYNTITTSDCSTLWVKQTFSALK